MGYRFEPRMKWVRQGIFSILYALILIFLGIYETFTSKMGSYSNSYIIVMVLVMVVMVYRAIYYFKLPHKFYLIIENNSISIHRGDLFPRKLIHFDNVKSAVKLNEAIILILDKGQEEPIDTDFLSDEDKKGLEKSLSLKLESKLVGF
ncbi:hypothetical protein IM538_13730 [Cytobacillus suaedae]|nr:hypothetical protein IM538_13730 [Cytobacillus suaedae]